MTFDELLAAAREIAARPGMTNARFDSELTHLLMGLSFADLSRVVAACNKKRLRPGGDGFSAARCVHVAMLLTCEERAAGLEMVEVVRRAQVFDWETRRNSTSRPTVREGYMAAACMDRLWDMCEERLGDAFDDFLDAMADTHELPAHVANRVNFERVCGVLGLEPVA